MSGLLERAKAFAIIAPYMNATDCARVAKDLGQQIAPEPKAAPAPPAQPMLNFERDIVVADPVVTFLRERGYEEADLVRAAGVMAGLIRDERRIQGNAAPITPDLLALLWEEHASEFPAVA